MTLAPPDPIDALKPYRQGRSTIEGMAGAPIKLSSNESSFGPSPRALEALQDVASTVQRYPDGAYRDLRTAISETHGLEADRVFCGNGSDEVISLLVRAMLKPGDHAVISEHAFVMARAHAVAQGVAVSEAPEPELRPSADAILAKVTSATRLITLATPNNPVGLYLPAREAKRLAEQAPASAIIVFDAAYADYVVDEDYESGAALAGAHPNIVMTRTFSKLYGLAGLRLGWAYAHQEVIERVNRIRSPFNVNVAAAAAGAAAVRDDAWADKVRAHNRAWLDRIIPELTALGLRVPPSVANFYLIFFPDEEGRRAKDAERFLLARNIIPRPAETPGTSNALRITVGLDHENEAVLEALHAFMAR